MFGNINIKWHKWYPQIFGLSGMHLKIVFINLKGLVIPTNQIFENSAS